jgi:hypothetical protein
MAALRFDTGPIAAALPVWLLARVQWQELGKGHTILEHSRERSHRNLYTSTTWEEP